MRKIISILVALGLVLAMSAMATPVAAAGITGVSVSVSPDCACAAAAYNITFNITASLTEGVHEVCIEFPAGTTVPASFADGKIKIGSMAVFGSEVTVTGQTVCFLVPKDIVPPGDNPVLVEFAADAGLKNPCTPGLYKVKVNTSRAPDSAQVESAAYPIAPAIESFKFMYDFGVTYPGIAKNFVPPFKACGQNDTGQGAGGFDTFPDAVGFMTGFNLTFMTDVIGCALPCVNATLWFELTACPALETITFNLSGTQYSLTSANLTTTVGTYDSAKDVKFVAVLPLTSNMTEVYPGLLHFSSVGSYQICFYAECPTITGCEPEASSLIAETCLDFEVHQWKDAFKIPLDEKWNLISLPLVPFDTDIDGILAALPAEALDGDLVDDLVSIWGYDGCTGEWFVHGNGQDTLTDLEDGKGYWVRMTYPNLTNMPYGLWVWGTEKPMPPAMPAEYPVCLGWNMIGFTSLTSMAPDLYLWNWDAPVVDPVVYEWLAGPWTTQGWNIVDFDTGTMNPGQGYWVAFPADGAIYVP